MIIDHCKNVQIQKLSAKFCRNLVLISFLIFGIFLGSEILSPTPAYGLPGMVQYGQAGSLAFYPSSGTTVSGTVNGLLNWNNTTKRLGIGTTSPWANLSINQTAGQNAFAIAARGYVSARLRSSGHA